ncbi:hypothetical protein L1987_77042 [Smallanthus sonchifolius]|uniref:Uncharacterized protein n=1 Tax=Smallanthus sonchifolius TaxID=185202 RepID=A0ACB8Z9R2_9ASTR|nr:hypothetical protein L1987_77042 [Smallanthus sonchifolius]
MIERAARTDVGAEVVRGTGVGKGNDSGIGITVMKETENMVEKGIGTEIVTVTAGSEKCEILPFIME